jgi:Domain of unknown function (DUF4157)
MSRAHADLVATNEAHAPRRAHAAVEEVVRSPGRPLEPNVRSRMEGALRHDLSSVRIHDDERARASDRMLGARAYTVGDGVVLSERETATEQTNRLISHELAHVVQQRPRRGAEPMGQSTAAAEREADALERTATTQRPQGIRVGAPRGIVQRLPKSGPGGGVTTRRESVDDFERRRRFTPPGAAVEDPRPPVLPADSAALGRIVDFMRRARTAISTLLEGPGKRDPWLVSTNANVQAVLNMMGGLLSDIQNGYIIIRFDQPAGPVAASYDVGHNLIHVKAVTDDNTAAIVMPSLLHEYAHAIQDRDAARLVVAARGPRESTAETEVQKELEGRLHGAYAAKLLRAVKMGPTDFDAAMAAVARSSGFHTDFETARTGTPAQRRAATGRLRERLEDSYAAQIAAKAPAVRHPVEILATNVARVHIRGPGGAAAHIDLGAIPAVKTQADLTAHLTSVLTAHAQFASLFTNPSGGSYVGAIFVVFFKNVDGRDEVVAQFTLGPPAAAAPAAPAPAAPATPPAPSP